MSALTEAQQWTIAGIIGVVAIVTILLLLSCFWQKDFAKHVYSIQLALFAIMGIALLVAAGYVWGASTS